jgi:hypothetical protein
VVGISASQLAYMLDGIDWRNPRHTWLRIPTMSLGHSEIMSLAVPT